METRNKHYGGSLKQSEHDYIGIVAKQFELSRTELIIRAVTLFDSQRGCIKKE